MIRPKRGAAGKEERQNGCRDQFLKNTYPPMVPIVRWSIRHLDRMLERRVPGRLWDQSPMEAGEAGRNQIQKNLTQSRKEKTKSILVLCLDWLEAQSPSTRCATIRRQEPSGPSEDKRPTPLFLASLRLCVRFFCSSTNTRALFQARSEATAAEAGSHVWSDLFETFVLRPQSLDQDSHRLGHGSSPGFAARSGLSGPAEG